MSLFPRYHPGPLEPQERFNGLSEDEISALGTYNAECSRGIAHTPAWAEKMAALQARFDEAERERERRWLASRGQVRCQ